jgi:hypothetical protein
MLDANDVVMHVKYVTFFTSNRNYNPHKMKKVNALYVPEGCGAILR